MSTEAFCRLDDIRSLIDEYCSRYRKAGLPRIDPGDLYSLNPDEDPTKPSWPDEWPFANRPGIYAIVSNGRVLYVGKASQQSIGRRLGSYFQYGPNRTCRLKSKHVWTASPTHVAIWAVPEETFFEASALEEFLIGRLKARLPDNSVGARA
jgi:hypothetical protein